MAQDQQPPVGIYEKALPANLSWEQRLILAGKLGYDYVEMSLDESDTRLSRLSWEADQRGDLRTLCHKTGVRIMTMCLSAHRKYPLGSADPEIRDRARQLMQDAIRFAVDVGISIVLVAGYDVFYEPSTPDTETRFLEGLGQAARWAAAAGVMLGLENVDTALVDSIGKAMYYVRSVGSPWLQLIADMGNLSAAGYHPPAEIRQAQGHLVGVHVKDAQPGVFRQIPFETGIVPFEETFTVLAEMGFSGPLTVEMWGDADQVNFSPDHEPASAVAGARRLVDRLIARTWPGRASS